MERSLLWSVFAIGLISWLAGLASAMARQAGTSESRQALPRPYLLVGFLLPFVVFVATLPSHGPLFAEGQGFGKGFLLGGLCAMLAALVPLMAGSVEGRKRIGAVVAAPCGLGLVATVVPLLMIRASLLDTLLGVAIGWFCGTVVLLMGAKRNGSSSESSATLSLVGGTGFTALLCGVAALGDMRGQMDLTATATVSWSVLGMVFAAGVPLALLLSGVLNSGLGFVFGRLPGTAGLMRGGESVLPDASSRNNAIRLWRVVLASGILLVLGKLLSARVVDDENLKLSLHLFQVMLMGLFGGAAVWWVTGSARRLERETPANAGAIAWQNNGVAALLLSAGIMVAYQMLAGFGVGLLLIGAWLAVSLSVVFAQEPDNAGTDSTASDTPAVATNLLRFGLMSVALLLYRVFSARFESELRGVSLTDQYAAFGMLLGALLPALLTGFLLRPCTPETHPVARIARLCLVGGLMLSAPALVLILWGTKCALALMLGLALGVAVLPSTSGVSDEETSPGMRLLPALLALGVCLALTQWTHHLLPLTQLTRANKEMLTVKIVVVMAALVLIADYSGRVNGWLRGRGGKPAVSTEGATR